MLETVHGRDDQVHNSAIDVGSAAEAHLYGTTVRALANLRNYRIAESEAKASLKTTGDPEPTPNRPRTNPKPSPNQPQTDPKPNPNRPQTYPKPTPNRSQTHPKPTPDRHRTDPKPTPNRAQTNPKLTPNLSQTDPKHLSDRPKACAPQICKVSFRSWYAFPSMSINVNANLSSVTGVIVRCSTSVNTNEFEEPGAWLIFPIFATAAEFTMPLRVDCSGDRFLLSLLTPVG